MNKDPHGTIFNFLMSSTLVRISHQFQVSVVLGRNAVSTLIRSWSIQLAKFFDEFLLF